MTQGYWVYRFAPHGPDHELLSLAQWLHMWGAGPEPPEDDWAEEALAGIRNFEQLYGQLSDFIPGPLKDFVSKGGSS